MKHLDLSTLFAPIAPQLEAVEEELDRILQSDLPVIQKLARHVAQGRGKRLRPALLLLISRFLGGDPGENIRFSAIYELIHTATLVHDDVIDHATTRRARPTLNALWGNTLTVLFGDLLYIQALGAAIQGRSWRLMEILFDVTARMIEGELLQHERLYSLDTNREDYFAILERKTALLFAGCTESAGVLAGRSAEECQALHRYGWEIGRAFQLVDDLLDLEGTEAELGKPVFSDLREGKLTLPFLVLRERCPDKIDPILLTLWQDKASLDVDQTLLQIIQEEHATRESHELAQSAAQAAQEALLQVQGRQDEAYILGQIPNLLLQRKY